MFNKVIHIFATFFNLVWSTIICIIKYYIPKLVFYNIFEYIIINLFSPSFTKLFLKIRYNKVINWIYIFHIKFSSFCSLIFRNTTEVFTNICLDIFEAHLWSIILLIECNKCTLTSLTVIMQLCICSIITNCISCFFC